MKRKVAVVRISKQARAFQEFRSSGVTGVRRPHAAPSLNGEPRTVSAWPNPEPGLKARFHPMIGDVKASEMAPSSYDERYFSTIALLAV